MTAEMLVTSLEEDGICLKIEGEKLKLEAPADRVPGPETIAGLRENKAAVLEYLRARVRSPEIQFASLPDPKVCKTDKLEYWPSDSLDAERRFSQPHARLFPFIGHKIRTPSGPGTLIQVFAERVTVLLDCERDGSCARFLPDEISPVAM
jgi:hypothetical protein